MTDQMEKLIEIYYEDSISLNDGKFLQFKRVPDYKCTERTAVNVSLEDRETQTIIDLGTHFDAKWIFSSPMNENLFWQAIKQNPTESKEIIKRLRQSLPGKELFAYQLQLKSISWRAAERMDKLVTIFKER